MHAVQEWTGPVLRGWFERRIRFGLFGAINGSVNLFSPGICRVCKSQCPRWNYKKDPLTRRRFCMSPGLGSVSCGSVTAILSQPCHLEFFFCSFVCSSYSCWANHLIDFNHIIKLCATLEPDHKGSSLPNKQQLAFFFNYTSVSNKKRGGGCCHFSRSCCP